MTESRKTGHLLTEKINPRTVHLDKCSPLEVVELILEEDRAIVEAIHQQKNNIATSTNAMPENNCIAKACIMWRENPADATMGDCGLSK